MIRSLPALIHNALQWRALLLERHVEVVATVVLWTTCLHLNCSCCRLNTVRPCFIYLDASLLLCVGSWLWSWGGGRSSRSSRDCDCDTRKCLTVEDNASARSLGTGQRLTQLLWMKAGYVTWKKKQSSAAVIKFVFWCLTRQSRMSNKLQDWVYSYIWVQCEGTSC